MNEQAGLKPMREFHQDAKEGDIVRVLTESLEFAGYFSQEKVTEDVRRIIFSVNPDDGGPWCPNEQFMYRVGEDFTYRGVRGKEGVLERDEKILGYEVLRRG